ncbi:MAG TPA: M23 family metallopeptidase [Blastocatellia bacterium]|nr:M23 family metallopeptidase [Blastocatellia bacterium]
MSEERRHYSLLIIPSSTSKARRLEIPRVVVHAAVGVVLSVVGLMVYALVRLTQHESLNMKYAAVRSENEKLKGDNDVYQNSYSKLKGKISFIEDMSRELARQSRMEHVPEIDEKVGAGGPETVTSLDRAADQLERQMRLIGDRMHSDQLRLSSIPTGLPVDGYLTDGFGIRRNPFGDSSREFHEGVDIAVDFGTPVNVTADGLVIWAAPYSGYGNLVAVYHSNGITSRYGHLSRITVESGQRVKRGDQVGHAGSTGRSTGPHVHYEIRENDQPVDPSRYVTGARQ